MTQVSFFVLVGIAGAALLIYELDRYFTCRRNMKRLMKIIMIEESCARQRREA